MNLVLRDLLTGFYWIASNGIDRDETIGEALDRIDRDRALGGFLPCIAVVEVCPSAAPDYLQWLLERITGSGPLTDPRWRQPTDAGVLYGPKRAAAWRTVDAKYFGLPQRRCLYVIASAAGDPTTIFEPYRSDSRLVH